MRHILHTHAHITIIVGIDSSKASVFVFGPKILASVVAFLHIFIDAMFSPTFTVILCDKVTILTNAYGSMCAVGTVCVTLGT